MTEGDT